jgi:hypothetical protein
MPPTAERRRKQAAADGPLPGQVLNEYDEYEDEESLRRRGEEARSSIGNKLIRIRRLFLQEISASPGKRAAFEILTELPMDWEIAGRGEPQPDEPWKATNQRQPDMILMAESGWTFGDHGYASIRQYVTKNPRACAVLVLNKPELCEGAGFKATLRRGCCSSSFLQMFGRISWPEVSTPDDQFGAMAPLPPRKMSRWRKVRLRDLNGDEQVCLAEAFTQSIQVFILIHSMQTLRQPAVFLPR